MANSLIECSNDFEILCFPTSTGLEVAMSIRVPAGGSYSLLENEKGIIHDNSKKHLDNQASPQLKIKRGAALGKLTDD